VFDYSLLFPYLCCILNYQHNMMIDTDSRIPSVESAETRELLTHYGVTFDENNIPQGGCTVPELFDEMDREFVSFYGEYGRQIVNASRTKWNEEEIWHFDLL